MNVRPILQLLIAATLPLWLAILCVVLVLAILWFAAGEVLNTFVTTTTHQQSAAGRDTK